VTCRFEAKEEERPAFLESELPQEARLITGICHDL